MGSPPAKQGLDARFAPISFDVINKADFPNTKNLSAVVAEMPPEARNLFVMHLAGHVKAMTGHEVPPPLLEAACQDSELIDDMLQASVLDLSRGIDQLNQKPPDPSGGPTEPWRIDLAGSFRLTDLATVPLPPSAPAPQQIAPGLYQGDIALPMTARRRSNIVIASVLDRLADNSDIEQAGDRFHLDLGTGTTSRLEGFTKHLKATGHRVKLTIEHRIANFANLKAKDGSGAWVDVPATLLLKTGKRDAEGREARVPSVHSEAVFEIRPGELTEPAGAIDADIRWFQGISGTGFFPCDLDEFPNWCGQKVADTFHGDTALKGLEFCGLMSDAINASARRNGWKIAGYGVTGVCNDSVGIIQYILSRIDTGEGRITAYPLMMRDEALRPEFNQRLATGNRLDKAEVAELATAIEAVPSDVETNDSTFWRARICSPWPVGHEPLDDAAHANRVLQARL